MAQRFIAAITGLLSVEALAAEVKTQAEKEFSATSKGVQVKRLSLIVLCLAVATSAKAQLPLNSEGAARVTRVLESLPKDSTLKCKIEPVKPALSFMFRFTAGYLVDCPMNLFEGKESSIAAYIRVTPAGGIPLVLMEQGQIPAIPPEGMAHLHRSHGIWSGGFALGEGRYLVEVLLVDNRTRFFRKQWTINAAKDRKQQDVSLAIKPGAVASLRMEPWDGKLAKKGSGLRVTVLLDVAPMNPRSATLRAWDRAFLLNGLLSLLQQVPCESVRLIAFNLDQQKEVFRKDLFDAPAFLELSHVLRNLELSTVSYRALQKESGPKMLAALTNKELAEEDTADAVIFFGPATRADWKTSAALLEGGQTRHPKFFYFEYRPWFGSNFPDAIEHLTKTLHGTVFQVHSPAEFGKSIQEMVRQLQSAKENEARNLGQENPPADK